MRFLVYNSITRWRTDAYCERKERSVYLQANARLTALKKEPEFARLNDVSLHVPLQRSFAPQQTAFAASSPDGLHIRLSKASQHKQAARVPASAFKYRDGKLYMARTKSPWACAGVVTLPSVPSTVAISKRCRRAVLCFRVPLRI